MVHMERTFIAGVQFCSGFKTTRVWYGLGSREAVKKGFGSVRFPSLSTDHVRKHQYPLFNSRQEPATTVPWLLSWITRSWLLSAVERTAYHMWRSANND